MLQKAFFLRVLFVHSILDGGLLCVQPQLPVRRMKVRLPICATIPPTTINHSFMHHSPRLPGLQPR